MNGVFVLFVGFLRCHMQLKWRNLVLVFFKREDKKDASAATSLLTALAQMLFYLKNFQVKNEKKRPSPVLQKCVIYEY